MPPQAQQPSEYNDQRLMEELLALEPGDPIGSKIQQQLATQPEPKLTVEQRTVILVLRDQASNRKAKELLARKDIRAYLCPALLRGSDDVFELSKIVTPLLLGFVAAGTIAIPLVPVLFAAIAFEITRMGITSICANYDKQNEEKKKDEEKE